MLRIHRSQVFGKIRYDSVTAVFRMSLLLIEHSDNNRGGGRGDATTRCATLGTGNTGRGQGCRKYREVPLRSNVPHPHAIDYEQLFLLLGADDLILRLTVETQSLRWPRASFHELDTDIAMRHMTQTR